MTLTPRAVLFTGVLSLALASVGCAPPPELRSIGTSTTPPVFAVPTQIPGFERDLRRLYVTLPDGSTALLDAMITRPAAPGRYPLVLMSHGSPRDVSLRPEMVPTAFTARAMAFARRGYGVAVVMRRGYAWSEGLYEEGTGKCTNRDYLHAARVSADDVLGAVRALAREDWVDPTKVLLVGESAGGMASLAAASANPDGVVGAISFAGGRGSDAPDHVCQADLLVYAMAELGKASHVRSLWVYAENDHYFDSTLARRMVNAYAATGAPAEFLEVPPFGEDGHFFFAESQPSEWWKVIEPFLTSLGLPTAVRYPPAPVALPAPPGLGPEGQQAFAAYLASDGFEKAFAVGTPGWGQSRGRRTTGDAAERALRFCREHGEGCAVYAIGNNRVGDPTAPVGKAAAKK